METRIVSTNRITSPQISYEWFYSFPSCHKTWYCRQSCCIVSLVCLIHTSSLLPRCACQNWLDSSSCPRLSSSCPCKVLYVPVEWWTGFSTANSCHRLCGSLTAPRFFLIAVDNAVAVWQVVCQVQLVVLWWLDRTMSVVLGSWYSISIRTKSILHWYASLC